MTTGLSDSARADTVFRTGRIKVYRPDVGTYRVSLDGLADCDARPIRVGVDKPYPVGTRVLCILPPTSAWLILGEIGTARIPKKAGVPQAPPDSIYYKDLQLRNADQSKWDLAKADFSDPNQDPLLEGDVEIANRQEARSYVRIDEYGNILNLASYYCFLFLSRVKNLFYAVAKDSLVSFAGFLFKSKMDDANKTATVRISINSDPASDTDVDVDVTAGAIPTDDERPTKNYTGDSRIAKGVYAVFGTHALLEVDNEAKEIRLSHVDLSGGKDQSTARQQVRLNKEEIAVEWDEDKALKVNEDGIHGQWNDSYLELTKDVAALVRGDASVHIDKDRTLLSFDSGNKIVINKNGVQIKGFLEIVGGKIKFSQEQPENTVWGDKGISDGTEESVTFSEQGGVLNLKLGGSLTVVNIDSNFAVRQLALVDTRFFTKYDTDMAILQMHTHPVPPVLTAVPGTAAEADAISAVSQQSMLSSKDM